MSDHSKSHESHESHKLKHFSLLNSASRVIAIEKKVGTKGTNIVSINVILMVLV